jgi:hypothetical protein
MLQQIYDKINIFPCLGLVSQTDSKRMSLRQCIHNKHIYMYVLNTLQHYL